MPAVTLLSGTNNEAAVAIVVLACVAGGHRAYGNRYMPRTAN